MARVQYSRHFHKNKRCLSQISDNCSYNLRQKKYYSNFFLPEPKKSKINFNANRKSHNLKKNFKKPNVTQDINNSNELRHLKRKQIFDKSLRNKTSIITNFDNTKRSFINNKIIRQFDLQSNENIDLKTNKFYVENTYKKNEQNNLLDNQIFSTNDYLIVDGYFESGGGAEMILADQEPLFLSDKTKLNTDLNDLYNINYFDEIGNYKCFNYEEVYKKKTFFISNIQILYFLIYINFFRL